MAEGAPQKEKTMATDVLEPSILKKISGIKDIPVQRPFYRLLGVIVKYFPGFTSLDRLNNRCRPAAF